MVILSPLRGVSITFSILVEPLCYALFTFLILKNVKKCKPLFVVIALALGRIILDLPLRFCDFESSLHTIFCPICTILIIFVTYLLFEYKYKVVLPVVISLSFWLYYALYGQKMWANYLSFGHCLSETNIANTMIYKSSNDSILVKKLPYRYLVLDFWSSNCGVCYKKFPLFQQLYDKYRDSNDVLVASVFIYRKNEALNVGDSILNSRNYTFSMFGTTYDSKLLLESEIKVVPTVLILNERKTIVYKGRIEGSLVKLEKLLNE